MATKYHLDVIHSGTDCGDFCIYQTNDGQMDDIRPLVWLSKTAHPGTKLSFEWTLDYCLAWSEQSDLTPGVVFRASQIVNADPNNTEKNTFLLTYEGGGFRFDVSDNPTKIGRLGIVYDSMDPKVVSVGVSMSGKPIYACVAYPGLKYTFIPRPRYWIAFGKFEEGEVIDLNRMTQRFEFKYPVNMYHRTLVLTANNTWQCQ